MLIVLWLCEKSLMLRGYILLQHPCNDLLSPMKSFKRHMQYKYVLCIMLLSWNNQEETHIVVRIFKCI